MINNFHISDKKCIFDVHSRPTLENNILSSHFIEAPVGRCGFDLRAFFIIMDTTKETEVWKEINGYDGYHISSLGRVKSTKRCRVDHDIIMKPSFDGRGYLQVCLYNNGKGKTLKIHKLMAIAFLNHKQNGMREVINHKDGNKENNNIDNIEVVSQRFNMNEYFRLNSHKLSSKYTGVHWNKAVGKWESQLKVNNKKICVGYFHSEIEASLAYQNKINELNLD